MYRKSIKRKYYVNCIFVKILDMKSTLFKFEKDVGILLIEERMVI